MKILTAQEVSSFELKKSGGLRGRSKNEELFAAMKQLEVGQTILLAKDEWVGKTRPGLTISYIGKKQGRSYHCFTLQDNSGWLISPKRQS